MHVFVCTVILLNCSVQFHNAVIMLVNIPITSILSPNRPTYYIHIVVYIDSVL